jgi:hypothetical protein
LPKEIKTKAEFVKLIPDALEVRVVKREELAKVKVKTAEGLYTFKTTPDEADEIVKGVKVDVVEL